MSVSQLRIIMLAAAMFGVIGCDDDAANNNGPPVPGESFALDELFTTPDFKGCLYASAIVVREGSNDTILAVEQFGKIVGLDPESGEERWSFQLPTPENTYMELLSTPTVVDERWVVLGWQLRERNNDQRLSHWVAVFDLTTHEMASEFEQVQLQASVPSYDETGTVEMFSAWQLMRGAFKHVNVPDRDLGLVYVPLGNGPSQNPYHGWVFEFDMDAWRDGSADDAVANILVTTAEWDCGAEGNANTMLCGGGVWTPAGPQVVQGDDDTYEIFVPTGNGKVDFDKGAYAHSVLRVGRGLEFDRQCDEALCSDFDEIDPSRECLDSCENIFVARLAPGDAPLAPESGLCDGLTFLECYGKMDGDLGANAPVIFQIPNGPRAIVQPGKDGALYLFDADHMGKLYHRLQVMDFCGTPDDKCSATWIGMFVTQPALTFIDDVAYVVVASVMADNTHPSGMTAVRIVDGSDGPQMEVAWHVPDFESDDAVQLFRTHPSRPIIFDLQGEPYVFVVDTERMSPPGTLWAVRVRDGRVVAREALAKAGNRFIVPLIHNDNIYVNICEPYEDAKGRLQAFKISGVS